MWVFAKYSGMDWHFLPQRLSGPDGRTCISCIGRQILYLWVTRKALWRTCVPLKPFLTIVFNFPEYTSLCPLTGDANVSSLRMRSCVWNIVLVMCLKCVGSSRIFFTQYPTYRDEWINENEHLKQLFKNNYVRKAAISHAKTESCGYFFILTYKSV